MIWRQGFLHTRIGTLVVSPSIAINTQPSAVNRMQCHCTSRSPYILSAYVAKPGCVAMAVLVGNVKRLPACIRSFHKKRGRQHNGDPQRPRSLL